MTPRAITEARLEQALKRLLNGAPIRIKPSGNLSLNKVNNEAGLGNSYIHKFPEFIKRARPQIDEYNKRIHQHEPHMAFDERDMDELSKLKAQLKRETRLKEKYRAERDDAIAIQKKLEALNSTLIFRVYEQQEKTRHRNVTNINK